MNIMIFTDNLHMYNSFIAIIDKKIINNLHNFEYACSPSNQFFKKIDNIKEINIKEQLSILVKKFDLIISCHSKQIFPSTLVNNVRCINIHPGLNPYNRGWYPQIFSIINNMPLGATIHEMDEEIDHGNIIAQQQVILHSWDTSLTAYNKVIEMEVKLLEKHIVEIINATYQSTPMSTEGNYNSKQDFDKLCKINLNQVASYKDVINHLRALTHGDLNNAYYLDEDKNKIYLKITLEKGD